MYNIEIYTNRNGQSEILNFLEALRTKSKTSKDARIQYNQIVFYIDLLAKNGSNLPIKITKHLEEDIWELRPGYNRVFYFFYYIIIKYLSSFLKLFIQKENFLVFFWIEIFYHNCYIDNVEFYFF